MVTANVARSEEEAAIQEKTGEAVITTEEDVLVDENASAEIIPEEGSNEEALLEISSNKSDDSEDGASDEASQEDSGKD